MFIWLVTVRASDGASPQVAKLVTEQLVPLLQSQPDCSRPALARCINCAGEHTYLGYWPTRAAVESFEGLPVYQELLDQLAPFLRVPPKRELWEILAS